ncbi:MAG: hypothetical protein QOD06_1145 [Candidatus Binatota bacterium]|jgi:aminoglycoside phosphotransferase (APT) family kinase protein|nr:hypothetical protein [Candidatus Binatota bacterium]
MPAATAESDDVPRRLEPWLAERLGTGVRVLDVRPATQGMSDETFFVQLAEGGGHPRELVIRRYRAGGVLREITDPERHFHVLAALGNKGIPVPRVLWFEPDTAVLGGAFFVMERVAGTVPVPWSTEGRAFLGAAGRGPVGEQFIDVLAVIHHVDWRGPEFAFLAPPAPGRGFALAEVEKLAELVARYRSEPEPIFEDAIGWLREHAPEPPAITLVHGDYRTGNLIYDGDRIAAVLDWEFACLGDPMLDVAWVCAGSNRMESDLVCYLLPMQRFLDGYRQRTGWDPSPERLRFWETFHQLRNALVWLSAGNAFSRGRTDDLRFARMALRLPVMRRLVAELLEYR